MPILTVVAGPNGSGKSTLTRQMTLETPGPILDPDAIARELNPADPSTVAIAAGREMLKRVSEALDRKESFSVETTLSSRSSIDLIVEAKSRGFEVHLLFVALDTPELNIARVRMRASLGGHFIPDIDVRRRYARSLANLPAAIRAADVAKLYDNTEHAAHRLVLVAKAGEIVWRAELLPNWLKL